MTAGLAERRAVRTVLPVPEPDLTPAELIARAAALKPLLRQQQAENDERGFYSQELHQAFLDAGLYRTLQPRMFGGYEFDIPTFYRAMLEISHGHPSAGWCLTLCASHPFLIASHWSERAQRELFGPDGRLRGAAPRAADRHAHAGRRRLPAHRPVGFLLRHPSLHAPRLRRAAAGRRRTAGGVLRRGAAREAAHSRRLGRRPNARHARQRLAQRRDQGRLHPGASCGAAAGPVHPPRRHARRHPGNAAARQSDVPRTRRRSLPHVADHAGHRRRQGGARRIPGSHPHEEHQLSADRPARRARGFSARARPGHHSDRRRRESR